MTFEMIKNIYSCIYLPGLLAEAIVTIFSVTSLTILFLCVINVHHVLLLLQVVANYFGNTKLYEPEKKIRWAGPYTEAPPDTPKCGFDNSKCPPESKLLPIILLSQTLYLQFRSNHIMNLLIFATVHSLMNYTNLIESCQTHCTCNTLRTWNSFTRSDTDVEIDSEPHLSRTCKTSLLFAPLAVQVQAGCSVFSILHPD